MAQGKIPLAQALCIHLNTAVYQFLTENLNKTRILTCILQHLNHKKILRVKILMQNVLLRQIRPRNFSHDLPKYLYKTQFLTYLSEQ